MNLVAGGKLKNFQKTSEVINWVTKEPFYMTL